MNAHSFGFIMRKLKQFIVYHKAYSNYNVLRKTLVLSYIFDA